LDTMRDYRVPPDPTETPRTTAGRIRAVLEPADVRVSDALALLARAEERARYARRPDGPDGLVDAVRAVRHALAARSRRTARARAAVDLGSVAGRRLPVAAPHRPGGPRARRAGGAPVSASPAGDRALTRSTDRPGPSAADRAHH